MLVTRARKILDWGGRKVYICIYPECFVRTILILNHKDLKNLPTKRVDPGYMFVHVFEEIVPVHNRVELELNPVFYTELLEWNKILDMIPLPAADFHIGVLVEGVAGHS